MTQEEKQEKQNQIKRLEEQMHISMPVLLKMQKMDVLKLLKYEFVKDKNSKEECHDIDAIANNIIDIGYRNISKAEEKDQKEIYKLIKSNYQFLGRRHLKEFMMAIEWEFAEDMKFYDIRKIVLDDWIKDLEALEYGILNGLSISAPPRSRENRRSVLYFSCGACYVILQKVASSSAILVLWRKKYIQIL